MHAGQSVYQRNNGKANKIVLDRSVIEERMRVEDTRLSLIVGNRVDFLSTKETYSIQVGYIQRSCSTEGSHGTF